MSFSMQKQSSRNLVLSSKVQAAWGAALSDANLTVRQRFNPSSVFMKQLSRRSDQMTAGKGTEWATDSQTTAWDTSGTLTSEADAYLAGWMMALIFGQEVVTTNVSAVGGHAMYLHNYSVPSITATMPCTTLYIEETVDQHFKMPDMSASSLSVTVPERGAITMALDMVGTGRYLSGTFSTALPALVPAQYLLGSDMQVIITPAAGAAMPFVGRQKGISLKIDRQAKPFQCSGDGFYAGSVASGLGKFSLDLTIAAQAADEVNGWFENQILLSVALAIAPSGLPYGMGLYFPASYVKANKLGNTEDKVMWQLSFDETSCIQTSSPAISAAVSCDVAAFLVAA